MCLGLCPFSSLGMPGLNFLVLGSQQTVLVTAVLAEVMPCQGFNLGPSAGNTCCYPLSYFPGPRIICIFEICF